MGGVEGQVIDGLLSLVPEIRTQLRFGEYFPGLGVKLKEFLRALLSGTRIDIAARRPFISFRPIAVMAGEYPVRPLINSFREFRFGAEVVYLPSAPFFTVGTQSGKDSAQVTAKVAPARIAGFATLSLEIIDPSRRVVRANRRQTGRLRTAIYPVHYSPVSPGVWASPSTTTEGAGSLVPPDSALALRSCSANSSACANWGPLDRLRLTVCRSFSSSADSSGVRVCFRRSPWSRSRCPAVSRSMGSGTSSRVRVISSMDQPRMSSSLRDTATLPSSSRCRSCAWPSFRPASIKGEWVEQKICSLGKFRIKAGIIRRCHEGCRWASTSSTTNMLDPSSRLSGKSWCSA